MSLAERIAQEFNTVRGEITESDSTAVKLTGSQTIEGVKTFTSSVQGNLVGNSATATKLATPRKITISGDVSGNTSFDGSTDVTLSAQVANDSHFHSTSTITGLGTAATANLTTSNTDGTVGRVLKVGDFGIASNSPVATDANEHPVGQTRFYGTDAVNTPTLSGSLLSWGQSQSYQQQLYGANNGVFYIRVKQNTTHTPWYEIHHAGNILQSTGSSTKYPMSQKATTDAINTVVNRSSKQIGEPFPIFTNITGVAQPDNSGSMKFIALSAGLTGAGKYNNGLLQNETVSGSWPFITATAVISVGPLAGQTIRLINHEGRYLRSATTSGTMQESQNKEHTHTGTTTENGSHVHIYTKATPAPGTSGTGFTGDVFMAHEIKHTIAAGTHTHTLNIANQGGDEARPRTITATYYMRIV